LPPPRLLTGVSRRISHPPQFLQMRFVRIENCWLVTDEIASSLRFWQETSPAMTGKDAPPRPFHPARVCSGWWQLAMTRIAAPAESRSFGGMYYIK
jgi:hypothetical protein